MAGDEELEPWPSLAPAATRSDPTTIGDAAAGSSSTASNLPASGSSRLMGDIASLMQRDETSQIKGPAFVASETESFQLPSATANALSNHAGGGGGGKARPRRSSAAPAHLLGLSTPLGGAASGARSRRASVVNSAMASAAVLPTGVTAATLSAAVEAIHEETSNTSKSNSRRASVSVPGLRRPSLSGELATTHGGGSTREGSFAVASNRRRSVSAIRDGVEFDLSSVSLPRGRSRQPSFSDIEHMANAAAAATAAAAGRRKSVSTSVKVLDAALYNSLMSSYTQTDPPWRPNDQLTLMKDILQHDPAHHLYAQAIDKGRTPSLPTNKLADGIAQEEEDRDPVLWPARDVSPSSSVSSVDSLHDFMVPHPAERLGLFPIHKLPKNTFSKICDEVQCSLGDLEESLNEVARWKDDFLKQSVSSGVKTGITLLMSRLQRRKGDMYSPLFELLRLVRLYSNPWSQKGSALDLLEQDYLSVRAALDRAAKKCTLLRRDLHKTKKVAIWKRWGTLGRAAIRRVKRAPNAVVPLGAVAEKKPIRTRRNSVMTAASGRGSIAHSAIPEDAREGRLGPSTRQGSQIGGFKEGDEEEDEAARAMDEPLDEAASYYNDAVADEEARKVDRQAMMAKLTPLLQLAFEAMVLHLRGDLLRLREEREFAPEATLHYLATTTYSILPKTDPLLIASGMQDSPRRQRSHSLPRGRSFTKVDWFDLSPSRLVRSNSVDALTHPRFTVLASSSFDADAPAKDTQGNRLVHSLVAEGPPFVTLPERALQQVEHDTELARQVEQAQVRQEWRSLLTQEVDDPHLLRQVDDTAMVYVEHIKKAQRPETAASATSLGSDAIVLPPDTSYDRFDDLFPDVQALEDAANSGKENLFKPLDMDKTWFSLQDVLELTMMHASQYTSIRKNSGQIANLTSVNNQHAQTITELKQHITKNDLQIKLADRRLLDAQKRMEEERRKREEFEANGLPLPADLRVPSEEDERRKAEKIERARVLPDYIKNSALVKTSFYQRLQLFAEEKIRRRLALEEEKRTKEKEAAEAKMVANQLTTDTAEERGTTVIPAMMPLPPLKTTPQNTSRAPFAPHVLKQHQRVHYQPSTSSTPSKSPEQDEQRVPRFMSTSPQPSSTSNTRPAGTVNLFDIASATSTRRPVRYGGGMSPQPATQIQGVTLPPLQASIPSSDRPDDEPHTSR